MNRLLRRFDQDESGATALEYGLILAIISIVIIVAAIAIGGSLQASGTSCKRKPPSSRPPSPHPRVFG